MKIGMVRSDGADGSLRIRSKLLVLVVAGLCSGQMCGVGSPTAGEGRLQVNDTLRGVCTAGDADILQHLVQYERNRQDWGWSYIRTLNWSIMNCHGATEAECVACRAAIVDQIYGRD